MLFTDDRERLRRFYVEAWRRHRAGMPLEPLEREVVAVVVEHPEYQPLLERGEAALERDYPPELGQTNPFLHMGLHLAIREQAATDRPAGFRAAYAALVRRAGGAHEAEHRIMDCLVEALWQAQRTGRPPDESAYLRCVRALAGGDPTSGGTGGT
ncbi:MAG TPA: DUF1841 family protein [Chromatiales bacterium]|nr:DUF1841 family protein [Chromatiales bacterium]